MKTATIIGGGFAGCVWADLLSKKGWKINLIEVAPMLGGGCQTLYYGGHPYTYGPRHLFTPHKHVYDYLNAYTPLNLMNHHLLTYVERDGNFYSYPIHADDIQRMPDEDKIRKQLDARKDPATAKNFEEYWIYSVGETLYDKFVKNYSKKMWQIEENSALTDFKFDGKGVYLQTGTRQVRPDWYVAYPIKLNGWDDYFPAATSHPNITVRLNTRIEQYDFQKTQVKINGEWLKSDIIISSIANDIPLEKCYGELEFIGRDFMKMVLPVEQVFPDEVYFLHYPNDELFTRVVEYKKMTGYKAPTTFLGIEIPSKKNKLYPYPVKEQQDLNDRYVKEFAKTVFPVGRMGNYRYYDVAMTIDEAMTKVKDL